MTSQYRASSRVILLNSRNEVLLFEIRDQNITPAHFWVPPGGGLEPNESWADAARRELFEETGLVVEAVGPAIWYKRKRVEQKNYVENIEEYLFLVRVLEWQVNGLQRDTAEVGHRWWTLAELRSSQIPIFPDNLAKHLEPILQGEIPSTPTNISDPSTWWG